MPKTYVNRDLDIEYFEEAIDMAASRDEVDPERIGICGSSKGGDIALSCAAFLKDKIKAVFMINACIYSAGSPTVYKARGVFESLVYCVNPTFQGRRVEASIWTNLSQGKVRNDGSFDFSNLDPNPLDFPETVRLFI